MKKAVLFDMFFTLADPRTLLETLECGPLGLSPREWAQYFWTPEIGRRRALGEFESGADLIDTVLARHGKFYLFFSVPAFSAFAQAFFQIGFPPGNRGLSPRGP